MFIQILCRQLGLIVKQYDFNSFEISAFTHVVYLG